MMNPIHRTLRNALFYLIVIASATLSLASIVVVMELNGAESAPASVSTEKLEASLSGLYQATRQRHNAPLPQTDSITLRTAATAAAAANATVRTHTLLALYRRHQAVVAQWEARTAAVIADVGQMETVAKATYAVESGRPGVPERERRFLALSDWYQGQTQTANAYLDSGRMALADVNIALASLQDPRPQADFDRQADSVRTKLNTAYVLVSHQPGFKPFPGREPVQADQNRVAGGRPWYVRVWNSRPRPITELSSWLRTERSLELASLIGMLGFGLLGAAASTVVRRKRAGTTAEDPISDDLSNLLLSGVSAALATYLAVKGGLAVVSSEGALPNAYLLLLTCFVAAVYWEEAWERVRVLIQGRQGQPANQQQGNGQEAPVAPAQPNGARAGQQAAPNEAVGKVQVFEVVDSPTPASPANPDPNPGIAPQEGDNALNPVLRNESMPIQEGAVSAGANEAAAPKAAG
jgi:hypothetical protein